jgi:hypothetical protein
MKRLGVSLEDIFEICGPFDDYCIAQLGIYMTELIEKLH